MDAQDLMITSIIVESITRHLDIYELLWIIVFEHGLEVSEEKVGDGGEEEGSRIDGDDCDNGIKWGVGVILIVVEWKNLSLVGRGKTACNSKIHKVWILVDLPFGKKAIGTKWVYRNKKDERGVVVRNKARLVSQGYRKEEGIDYDEVQQKEDGIFISQDKYVAEILKKFDFDSVKTANTPIETQKPLIKDEEAADVDVSVTPKTLTSQAVKRIFRYLKGKPKLGLWYPRVSSFDLEAYSDSDYAGANLDRKSTTGGCQFLGRRLISWQCKKQTIVATSTTEAEYVAAANCCGQFWNTATSKTVNDASYIKAKVAGKTISISEASIRQDLLFNDVDGIDCLTNQEIYENLQLMGYEENLKGTGGSQRDHVQIPHDSPLSGGHTSDRAEGGLNLDSLLKTCNPTPHSTKHGLRSVSSCQGRKSWVSRSLSWYGLHGNRGSHVNCGSDKAMRLRLNLDAEVPEVGTARPDIDTARPEVHTANAPVSTAGVTISTANPKVSAVEPRTPPTTTSIFDDEDITMAQTLINMKEEKAKEKGVAFKDVEDSSRPVRSITTLKPLPSIDPKDKGKGILVEEETVKIKRKDQGIDQIERDEELAYKLHKEELAEIARIQEEKAA
ncbi:putative ribonuclease H-like domain-containing protein [Tanacetum coccineum]